MIIVWVCKVIAVFLLCTEQTCCANTVIYDENADSTTSQVLTRLRRTLIGAGGGGIIQSKPPTPFEVKQNQLVPTPLSFSLTINFSRNNKSVSSNNFRWVGVTPTTRAPLTRKIIPTTKSPAPKLLTKPTTSIPTTRSTSTTTPNPHVNSHFRKLNTKKKQKDKSDPVFEITTNNEQTVTEVDDVTEVPVRNDVTTENVQFFSPLEEISTPEMVFEDPQVFEIGEETTKAPIITDPLTPFRTILSRDQIIPETPTVTDTGPGFRTMSGRDRTLAADRNVRGPKTMATIRKGRKKGKGS